MLSLIDDRLKRKLFDDVMEVAWSTMWNVTDETAVNCERFLNGYGMEYFLGCLRVNIYYVYFNVYKCLVSVVRSYIIFVFIFVIPLCSVFQTKKNY